MLLHILCVFSAISLTVAGHGYHYPAPFIIKPVEDTGHFFPIISTVAPLPPVPALPPLPTPRPNESGLVQIHSRAKALRPAYIQATGRPVQSTVSRITQAYRPVHHTGYAPPRTPNAPPGYSYPHSEEQFYLTNGRTLKQYAVVEIIENDVELPEKPFLTGDFFNPMRARIGSSGIGATAFSGDPENQFNPTQALLLEQQRIAQQLQPLAAAGDTINLGSGGLGYIRLPNGNIYLGSGSLGYISGQEHNQSVLEARTRAEANNPDPLHFGHGRNQNFFPNN